MMMMYKTKNEIWVNMVNTLVSLRSRLTDVSIRSELGKLFRAVATEGEEIYSAIAKAKSDVFLDSATGDDLDLRASDYRIVRKTATYAKCSDYTFHGEPGTVVPAGYLVQREKTIYRYSVDADVVLNDDGTGVVGITALEPGEQYRAEAGTITEFINSPPAGLDWGTNPSRTVGGSNRETDNELRERVREHLSLLARGTPDSVREMAMTVPGVRYAIYQQDYPQIGMDTIMVADSAGQFYAELNDVVKKTIIASQGAGRQFLVSPAVTASLIIQAEVVLLTGYSIEEISPLFHESLRIALQSILTFGATVYPDNCRIIPQGVRSCPSVAIKMGIDCLRIPGVTVYDFTWRDGPVERTEIPVYYDASTQYLSIGNYDLNVTVPGLYTVMIKKGPVSTVNLYIDTEILPRRDSHDTMVFLFTKSHGIRLNPINLPVIRKVEFTEITEETITV